MSSVSKIRNDIRTSAGATLSKQTNDNTNQNDALFERTVTIRSQHSSKRHQFSTRRSRSARKNPIEAHRWRDKMYEKIRTRNK